MLHFKENAMRKGYHITTIELLNNQTWDELIKEYDGQRVYIWGMGQGICLALARCRYFGIDIAGVVDNDIHKQGFSISDFYDVPETYRGVKVVSKQVIEELYEEKCIVIICSNKYYEDIYNELSLLSNAIPYSLLHMEINLSDGDLYGLTEENKNKESPINKNKIFFFGMSGTFCNHEKYITKALLVQNKNLNIVWSVSHLDIDVPNEVKLVYSGNTDQIKRETNDSYIVITSTLFPEYIKKREGQIWIHLKHWGSITLKKFYLDAPSVSRVCENDVKWKKMFDQLDYIFVGSDFDAESCRRGFSPIPKMIYTGSARSDVLFNPGDAAGKVREYYRIDEQKRLVLYAPTYRFENISVDEKYKVNEVMIDFNEVINALSGQFGDDWIVLLRLHPSVSSFGRSIAEKVSNIVVDTSMYDDSQELIAASDVLITDYSSIMFEPSYVNKPVFLFAPDCDAYINNEYELLINYSDLPFHITKTNDELVSSIRNFKYDEYVLANETFLKHYRIREDGQASERAAKFLMELIK